MRYQSSLPGQAKTVLIVAKAPYVHTRRHEGEGRHYYYYHLSLLVKAKTPRTPTIDQASVDVSNIQEEEQQSAGTNSLLDMTSGTEDAQTQTDRISIVSRVPATSQNSAVSHESTGRPSGTSREIDLSQQLSGSK